MTGPELIIGLVGAVGTDLELVTNFLTDTLAAVDYRAKPLIRLATLLRDLPDYNHLPEPSGSLDVYIDELMTASDEFRERTGRNDAMAILGIGEIIQQRKEADIPQGGIIQRRAYILRSLKHEDEAESLREVYGSSFFLIAAYAPHNARRNNLARGIAQSRNEYPVDRHYATAETLINRDQEELGLPHGQNLRDTFHRADAFVDTTDHDMIGAIGLPEGCRMTGIALGGRPWNWPVAAPLWQSSHCSLACSPNKGNRFSWV